MALEDLPEKLWPLPVERLWGVGPRTAARLSRGGVATIGNLLSTGEDRLRSLVGIGSAAHLLALARGEDTRPVKSERQAKSISEERTYGEDLTAGDDIDRALLARSEGVARQLRRQGLVGRTVHLKVRTGDYTTWTRSHKLREPTDLAEPLVGVARRMFRERIRLGREGVRLLGVGVSGLEPEQSVQRPLFTSPEQARARRLARASDAVRNKLGEKALTRARLIKKR